MKRLIAIFAFVITLSLVFAIFPGQIPAQQNDINFQEFYNQLSPYGQWIDNSNYGYIWIPTAGPDFTPYLTNGYWVLTDDGWTWVSGYDWGWAPFHYGRWDYNGSYGWFWVPDSEWGPSWVTWRSSDGYYGWAPMRPGVSISVTFGSNNDVPNDRWIFIRDKDIESHDIGKNHISRKNNLKMMNGSTVINKTYYDDKRRATYVAGPGREDVQKITGRTIKPVAVHEKDKPGQTLNNGQLQIYRPQVQKNNTGNKPTPSQLANLKDVKQISERNTGKQQQNIQSLNVKTGKKLQTVNLPKKINTKAVLSQSRNKNQPDNSISKALQSATVSKTNSKNSADRSPKTQAMNPPKDDRSTDRPPDAGTMIPARDNRSTDRPPVTQTMNAPKDDRSTDRPPKTDPNDDNRRNREP